LVACLVFKFASDYVKNERVTRNFLILFYLDNVTCLNATPVGDLKALVALRENKFFDSLGIHFIRCLLELPVVNKVESACRYNTRRSNEGYKRVISGISAA